jgi:hypothetical protein
MIAFVTRITLVALSLGWHVGPAVADSPPRLNAGPSCDAAARGAVSLGRDKDTCMSDERDAKDALTKTWSRYSRVHKAQCVGMTNRGGPPSYVELISCLDIMTDAAVIHEADPLFGSFGRYPKESSSNQTANRSAKRPVLQTPPTPVVSKAAHIH